MRVVEAKPAIGDDLAVEEEAAGDMRVRQAQRIVMIPRRHVFLGARGRRVELRIAAIDRAADMRRAEIDPGLLRERRRAGEIDLALDGRGARAQARHAGCR